MSAFTVRISFWFLSVSCLAGWLATSNAFADAPPDPRFPSSNNEDAWKRLPRKNPALPAWAKILVSSLPKTTAAMLELDYVYRAENPLGSVLYGKLRWAAADASGCVYSKQYAEADLKRAGLSDADLKKLTGDFRDLPESERLALNFARKLTRAAHMVTDDEVAELLKHFGPEKVVGIVHTLAHANFQDRIFLALGVKVEPGGPLPPLDAHFDSESQATVPDRPSWKELPTPKKIASNTRPDWLGHDFADVQKSMTKQKGRKARIPLPDAERFAKLPADVKERSLPIAWSNVSLGYQPRLTKAWFDCMGTFQKEAALDRVFSNTYFWVVTRSNECFY